MKLKTEQNTKVMERRVIAAARAYQPPLAKGMLCLKPFFEHGQWWIENVDNGAQYSVVDAEGGASVDGFDFEQVTEGEES